MQFLLAMTSGKGNIYIFFCGGGGSFPLGDFVTAEWFFSFPASINKPSTNIACMMPTECFFGKDQPANMRTTVAATGMLSPKVYNGTWTFHDMYILVEFQPAATRGQDEFCLAGRYAYSSQWPVFNPRQIYRPCYIELQDCCSIKLSNKQG